MHNFTDGLALGTTISSNLGLGLSTAIAILFHEIPHELSELTLCLSFSITQQQYYVHTFIKGKVLSTI